MLSTILVGIYLSPNVYNFIHWSVFWRKKKFFIDILYSFDFDFMKSRLWNVCNITNNSWEFSGAYFRVIALRAMFSSCLVHWFKKKAQIKYVGSKREKNKHKGQMCWNKCSIVQFCAHKRKLYPKTNLLNLQMNESQWQIQIKRLWIIAECLDMMRIN